MHDARPLIENSDILINFIGSIYNSYITKGDSIQDAKKKVIKLLVDCIDRIAKNEDGYDIYVLNPLFNELIIIISLRVKELEKVYKEKQIDSIENTVIFLNEFLSSLKILERMSYNAKG